MRLPLPLPLLFKLAPLILLVITTLPGRLFAAPILTEIHYNGVFPGADPDEFIEITNPGKEVFSLNNYTFGSGITLDFSDDILMPAFSSLVLAKDIDAFAQVFSDFTGSAIAFGGGLSNGGETLTLLNPLGEEVWSVTYDDAGEWPRGADGTGDSLQRVLTQSNGPEAWVAAPPTPGRWSGFVPEPPVAPVSAPPTLWLLGFSSALLAARAQRRRHSKCESCEHRTFPKALHLGRLRAPVTATPGWSLRSSSGEANSPHNAYLCPTTLSPDSRFLTHRLISLPTNSCFENLTPLPPPGTSMTMSPQRRFWLLAKTLA